VIKNQNMHIGAQRIRGAGPSSRRSRQVGALRAMPQSGAGTWRVD
jgi:hypothetical protein